MRRIAVVLIVIVLILSPSVMADAYAPTVYIQKTLNELSANNTLFRGLFDFENRTKANKTTIYIAEWIEGNTGQQNFTTNHTFLLNSTELWINRHSMDLFRDYNETCTTCINITYQLNQSDIIKVKYIHI